MSKEVMHAYMERHNVPVEYFAEVFELNSVIDAELRALLDTKLANMDAAIAAYLKQISLVNNDKVTMHRINRRINQYRKVYDLTLDKMALYKYSIGDVSVALGLLQDRGSVYDKLLEAQIQAKKGNLAQAHSKLQEMQVADVSFENMRDLMLQYWAQIEHNQLPTASGIIKMVDPKNDFSTSAFIQGELAMMGTSSHMIIPQVNPQNERMAFNHKNRNKEIVTIYPNPTTDYFRVRGLPANQWVEFKLIDANGKVVMYQAFTTTTDDKLIELDNIPTSNYTYAISSENTLIATGKITVQ